MKRLNPFRIFFAIALLACGLATVPANAADKVTLMLNWYTYGEHAPFYYGLVKGYYADEGIDLDIQDGRSSSTTVQAVSAHSVTFGYADIPTMMRAAIKGAPVIATGVALQKNPMTVMSLPEKNIVKPEDIKGKIVSTTAGGSTEQIWPLFLQNVGVKETDFSTVSGDTYVKVNSVINGQADIVIGYPMDQGMKILDATGKRVNIIKFADFGVNLVSSGIVANKDTNPDLIKRFMAASTRSVSEAVKDPKGAVDAILKTSPKAGKYETLLEGFELTKEFYKDNGNTPSPLNVPDQVMKDTVVTMVEHGGLDAVALKNPKAFYTNQYLAQ